MTFHDTDYRDALKKAREDLAVAARERAALDKRIARLSQTVNALAALVEPGAKHPIAAAKFTDMVRTVLQAASEPLTAPEIKTQIDAMGYKWKNPANALQQIHNTMKRLIDAKQVQVLKTLADFGGRQGSQPRYQWVSAWDYPYSKELMSLEALMAAGASPSPSVPRRKPAQDKDK